MTILEARQSGGGPVVLWAERAQVFTVTTLSSSTCVPTPVSIDALETDQVVVEFSLPDASACTADDAATTHEFELPEEVDGSAPVTVTVSGLGKDITHTLD